MFFSQQLIGPTNYLTIIIKIIFRLTEEGRVALRSSYDERQVVILQRLFTTAQDLTVSF